MTWLLTRGRAAYLLAVGCFALWALSEAVQVGVEKSNQSLNTRDPGQLATYARFKEAFGSDEDLVLAVHDEGLLSASGLARIAELTKKIAALDAVRNVFSLTNAKQLVAGPDGAEEALLVVPPYADRAAVEAVLDRNPDFEGWLISPDRTTAGIVIEMADRAEDDEYRADLIQRLRGLMASEVTAGVDLHLTGVAVQKYDVTQDIERDQRVLMPLAVLTLALILAAFFRSWLGVALPLCVTGLSVLATQALFHVTGFEVNAITALLPPVIMVLSIAVSVHIVQGWLQSTERDPIARIIGVARNLAFPCFFCSLTTALGFASLLVGDMPAVRQFGIFAAFGVLVSFVLGMTLVPVGLTFLTPPASPFQTPQHRFLQRSLEWCAHIAVSYPWRVLAVFAALTVLSAAGVPHVRNNTDLVRFLPSDAPLFRDTMFIDTHLTGANSIELVIQRKDGEPLNSLDAARRMETLETVVRKYPEVTTVSGIQAVLRQLQRAESGSDTLALPENERDAGYLFDLLDAATDRSLIDKLITRDLRAARVSIRIHAVGTAVAAPLAEQIVREGQRIFGEDYTVTPTGAFYHVAIDSNRLVADQVQSFGTGLLAVFLAIGIFFRSWKPTIISMIPNVIPIVWTAGLMGVFSIDLSSGTAMIASAVIGLVVDDTIHYLTDFYRAFAGDAEAAVYHATTGIGSALVVNNLSLVLGFWVGCFGSFKPTIYFSLLSGITMITAMVCDLFVTPACLVVLERLRPPVGK